MSDLAQELFARFPDAGLVPQPTREPFPTFWVRPDRARDVLRFLGREIERPFPMLFDLCGIDERERVHREGQPESDFTVCWHLLSFDRNDDVRIKVPLRGEFPSAPTVTDLWPNAAWYEREAYDLLGIGFEGHDRLRRLLMPPYWEGHPLRREHPARATELGPYELPDWKEEKELEELRFRPEAFGLDPAAEGQELLFLNVGPQHPGTHGVLRFVLQLEGERILEVVPDIGFHHRAAEKMAERQTWHKYIPYTDRVDYMAGVQNELPYVLAVERLAGIEVPERCQVIRVMMAELFRIISHLVWYATYAQDVGQMSSIFYMFNDRERAFDLVEAITGGRMHPAWFRIGGVAQDLPQGWDEMFRAFLAYLPPRLDEYEDITLHNPVFRGRTVGVGGCTLEEAIAWGMSGPMLRACGLPWDLRKKRPYSGYDRFEFEVCTATGGDCYARALVHVEEIRQSLRILEQCVRDMPDGPTKADHRLATPPRKDSGTMHDIETLIHHFVNVSWGPPVPPGEGSFTTEAPKGMNAYYLVSDGGTGAYRLHIRTPSYPHIQAVPMLSRGLTIQDLVSILGSIDFVIADIDR